MSSQLNVSPLSAKAVEGFVEPMCQQASCGNPAAWLVRGHPPLAVCAEHLGQAVTALSEEEA